ncbi:uncharacterized protein LOC143048777 [Mytilus galloprovincialis]|uniref:uncharacterized protein LOC143048777 n=1 Tax=Mytilus galloprovincialis TaxID=29158 RepID=UPI003F7CAD08
MADSREEHDGGQAPLLCQICEIARGIEWKCLDCDLLMCQKCKEKIHPKFKLTNEHKIVNIKDVGNKEVQVSSCEEEIWFGNIKCTEHCEEICCLYCQLCDKLICMQCVTKTHKSHIFEEMKCGYLIKKDKLMKHTRTLKNQQESLTNEIEKLEKVKEENNLQHRQVIEEIATREKVVKKEVENYTLSFKNELDEKLGFMQQGTEKEIDRVKTMKEKIQEKLTKAEEFINIKDGAKFFQNIEGIEKSLKEDVQMTTFEKETLPTFVPGKMDQCNFGTFKYNNGNADDIESPCAKVQLTIGKEYQTSLTAVIRVAHSADNHILVYSQIGPTGFLKKCKPTESQLREISSYDIIVRGMAFTPWRDILVCTNDNKIKRIDNTTGEIRNSKYNVGSLIPVAICIKDNCIVVGAINDDYPENGKRVVIKMNESGRHDNRFECDAKRKPIFLYPISLASSNNARNIFVVDGLSDIYGDRITMLMHSTFGYSIQYYHGHSSINSFHKQFKPTDIQATSSNNIIVNDTSTNTLHILNQSGQVSSYIDLSSIGIQNGFSLCCTSKQLFIGCLKVQEKISDSKKEHPMAKLYELSIENVLF